MESDSKGCDQRQNGSALRARVPPPARPRGEVRANRHAFLLSIFPVPRLGEPRSRRASCRSSRSTADAYDAWARRWFLRWLGESRRPSIEQAAELAATLADVPSEPQALKGLLGMLWRVTAHVNANSPRKDHPPGAIREQVLLDSYVCLSRFHRPQLVSGCAHVPGGCA
jgi:hypothetical protein